MALEEIISSCLCIQNCSENNNCQCVNMNNDLFDMPDVNSNDAEIIAKGHSVLTSALRTLRLSKSSNQFALNTDVQILVEEKCRPTITLREVADHDCIDDCWIILYDRVYNVTEFLNQVTICQTNENSIWNVQKWFRFYNQTEICFCFVAFSIQEELILYLNTLAEMQASHFGVTHVMHWCH